jgi:hypothetical protein
LGTDGRALLQIENRERFNPPVTRPARLTTNVQPTEADAMVVIARRGEGAMVVHAELLIPEHVGIRHGHGSTA